MDKKERILMEERERQRTDLSGLGIFLVVVGVVCLVGIAVAEAGRLADAIFSYLETF